MFAVQCPHCHTHLTLDESLVGRRVRCPKCRRVLCVPELPSEEIQSFPTWLLAFCGAGIGILALLLLIAAVGFLASLGLVLGIGVTALVLLRGRQSVQRLARAAAESTKGTALQQAPYRPSADNISDLERPFPARPSRGIGGPAPHDLPPADQANELIEVQAF